MTTTMNAADTDALDDQVGQMGAKADSRTTDRSTTTARSLRRELLDGDLIDELISRVGEGSISLTGKDGSCPSWSARSSSAAWPWSSAITLATTRATTLGAARRTCATDRRPRR